MRQFVVVAASHYSLHYSSCHGGNRKQIFPPQSSGTISGPSGPRGSRGLNNSYAIQSFKPCLLAAGVNRKDVPLAVRQENVTKLSARVLEAR